MWFRYPAASEVSVASLEATAETVGDLLAAPSPGDWVLRDVSFVAEPGHDDRPGRAVGRGQDHPVGPASPGSTTWCEGSLTIDGHDVRDVTLASVTGAVGVVTQDAHLFHDTIAANLRYARPGRPTRSWSRPAGRPASTTSSTSLPDGYDTVVGERGYRLSGGEKQRLAIARVLLKDPAVVILDEATAHLDSETELLVQQALAEALRGRTSIVIAHRLSTIQAADQILVLERRPDRGPGHPRLPDRAAAACTPTSTKPNTCGAARWRSPPVRGDPCRRGSGAGSVRVTFGGLQPAPQAGGVGMDAVEGLELVAVLRVDASSSAAKAVLEGSGDVLTGPPGRLGHLRPAAQDPLRPPPAWPEARAAGRSGPGPPRPVARRGTCVAT